MNAAETHETFHGKSDAVPTPPATRRTNSVLSWLMAPTRFAIVPTALGVFAAAWSSSGVGRTWLHERTPERARAQIRRSFPEAVERPAPPPLVATMDDVAALLAGQ